MRISSTAVLTVAAILALPIHAQAPAQPTTTAAPPASPAVSTERAEEPSLQERRIVAYVSTGVAVVSLAAGVTMAVLAKTQFDCAADIIECNKGLENKIVGQELFDLRAEIEQKALFADMAFLFAGASAVVATVGYLRGFVFVDEAPGENAAPVALSVPVMPAVSATVVDVNVAAASTSLAPVAALVLE